jgi:hypothetical protein
MSATPRLYENTFSSAANIDGGWYNKCAQEQEDGWGAYEAAIMFPPTHAHGPSAASETLHRDANANRSSLQTWPDFVQAVVQDVPRGCGGCGGEWGRGQGQG